MIIYVISKGAVAAHTQQRFPIYLIGSRSRSQIRNEHRRRLQKPLGSPYVWHGMRAMS